MSFCTFSHSAIAIATLLVGSFASAEEFRPNCESPSFPTPAPSEALGIDHQCGLVGSGGAEAKQNTAKNNFCATGEPKPITIEELKKLQTRVDNDHSINFGDRNTSLRHRGPTTNRGPLEAMGEGNVVTFRGFVLKARQEGHESVNCGQNVPDEAQFHDIHISLVAAKDVRDECSGIVAEMVPHHRPATWTQENVQKVADAALPVRVTGQLLFDSSHVPCERGNPVGSNPKRMSLWEVHPIYKFEICTSDCDGTGKWLDLDAWAKQH